MRHRMGSEPIGTVEALRPLAHGAEQVRRARGGMADAMHAVRHPAELLEDGVIGDGAEFAGMADARRPRPFRLARGGTRTGLVEQRGAERADQRGIAGIVDEFVHLLAHGLEELAGEIRLVIDRVLGHFR